jgi:hypothetical protein
LANSGSKRGRKPPQASKPAARARPGADPRLPSPPPQRVDRIQLIRREVRELLSPGAIDLLFAHGDCVVEGGLELLGAPQPGDRVYATIMVTIDLARCAAYFREPADAATAERVSDLMRADPSVRQRLIGLVRPRLLELAASASRAAGSAAAGDLVVDLEHTIRCEGLRILIDGDAMAQPSRRRSR